MVSKKKSLAPVDQVMIAERVGGWGRCFRGIERALKKLDSSDDTKADVVELSNYLDLLTTARQLQPANLATISHERLEFSLNKLCKAGVFFPTVV